MTTDLTITNQTCDNETEINKQLRLRKTALSFLHKFEEVMDLLVSSDKIRIKILKLFQDHWDKLLSSSDQNKSVDNDPSPQQNKASSLNLNPLSDEDVLHEAKKFLFKTRPDMNKEYSDDQKDFLVAFLSAYSKKDISKLWMLLVQAREQQWAEITLEQLKSSNFELISQVFNFNFMWIHLTKLAELDINQMFETIENEVLKGLDDLLEKLE